MPVPGARSGRPRACAATAPPTAAREQLLDRLGSGGHPGAHPEHLDARVERKQPLDRLLVCVNVQHQIALDREHHDARDHRTPGLLTEQMELADAAPYPPLGLPFEVAAQTTSSAYQRAQSAAVRYGRSSGTMRSGAAR